MQIYAILDITIVHFFIVSVKNYLYCAKLKRVYRPYDSSANAILQLGDIEALQAALDRDRGFKGKRVKKPQKRIRRSGKKNKRKKEKDLTPDRTTESLFEELLMQGIIKLHREVSLDEFKGEKSFVNYDLRVKEKDPLPALGTLEYIVHLNI